MQFQLIMGAETGIERLFVREADPEFSFIVDVLAAFGLLDSLLDVRPSSGILEVGF